jgi:hypothetical protein
MGGILIKDEDLITVRQAIADFKKQWPKIKAPLHFTEALPSRQRSPNQ